MILIINLKYRNPIVDCESSVIPRTSLLAWKEENKKYQPEQRQYKNRPRFNY
jgi:hypothetical protein